MLNYLWGFMLLTGILWGAANNSLDAVTQGLLNSAGDAVKLCLTMAGVMSFWCGILEVGNRAGLIEWLAYKMEPILTFLFPDLDKDHPARLPISVNMAANMLGLGMAATPAGLEAMKLMQEGKQSKATNAMCTFLIINISSLQLVPVTMIRGTSIREIHWIIFPSPPFPNPLAYKRLLQLRWSSQWQSGRDLELRQGQKSHIGCGRRS